MPDLAPQELLLLAILAAALVALLSQRVRADPALSACRVVLLTANVTPTLREQAGAAGAVDFILKPFDAAHLLARIRAALAE